MKYIHFYWMSVLGVIAASFYPIYMGCITLGSYLQKGFVDAANYPKYIIPYTPICIALIAATALMPQFFKWCKRHALFAASILGIAVFLVSEWGFEQIKVVEGYVSMPLQSWQLGLCMATPEVLRSLGQPIYAANNPAFKIHFYIIAIVMILAVLNVIYGLSKMLRDQDFSNKRPLFAQAFSVILFVALCVLACFTAFYRNGTIHISPLSASLMALFFIVFGNTVGIYFGSLFYKRKKIQSEILPAAAASLTTLVMYLGEMVLMDGALYKYGSGFFFLPIGVLPFAAVDIAIILFSGLTTYFIVHVLHKSK